MNKVKIAIISAITVIAISASSYYYLTPHKKQNKRHGMGTMELSCDDSVIFSLRLKRNGEVIWSKTHDELFSLPEAIPATEGRFHNRRVMPLQSLLKDQPKFTWIEAIPCDNESATLDYTNMINSEDFYYLSQNNKGRMKLLKLDNKRNQVTLKRNVIDINLID